MRDGFTRDDSWIMVEDEFLETAKLYTVHLHQAEYQRLKDIARAQRVNLICDISRPVDARSLASAETRKQREAEALRKTKDDAVQEAISVVSVDVPERVDDDDLDDAPWMRDPQLSRLMGRPPKTSKLLARTTGVKSKTRASAGFGKAKERYDKHSIKPGFPHRNNIAGLAREINLAETNGEEDGSDASLTLVRSTQSKFDIQRVSSRHPRKDTSARSSGGLPFSTPEISSKYRPPRNIVAAKVPDAHKPSKFAGRLAQKMAEKARQENEEKRKSIALDEIPTFLI